MHSQFKSIIKRVYYSVFQFPVTRIPALNPGIIFFPDYTYSNPYQTLLYQAIHKKYGINILGFKSPLFTKGILRRYRFQAELLHIHWLNSFFDATNSGELRLFFAKIEYAKKLGYKILWTVHNLTPHESSDYEREKDIRKKFAALCDYIAVHGRAAKNMVVEQYATDPEKIFIVLHGAYTGHYEDRVSREKARDYLSLSPKHFVFLFFGAMRKYKGLEDLIDIFRRVHAKHPEARLVLAGRLYEAELADLVPGDLLDQGLIQKHFLFIGKDEAQYFFRSADIAVFPYRNILTSGAAILSVTFRVPVIVPDRGLMPELVNPDIGYLYTDMVDMEKKMISAAEFWKSNNKKPAWKKEPFDAKLRELDWNRIVENGLFKNLFAKYYSKSHSESKK